MGMVWFGNVYIFNKGEFPTVLIYVTQKSLGAAPTYELSMARTSANYIGPFSTNSLISMVIALIFHCKKLIKKNILFEDEQKHNNGLHLM
jgi:hypothetical protein